MSWLRGRSCREHHEISNPAAPSLLLGFQRDTRELAGPDPRQAQAGEGPREYYISIEYAAIRFLQPAETPVYVRVHPAHWAGIIFN